MSGKKDKDIICTSLTVQGKCMINSDGTMNANTLDISKTLNTKQALVSTELVVNGDTTLNSLNVDGISTLNDVIINGNMTLRDPIEIPSNVDSTYSIIKNIEGTMINVGDFVEHNLYTQINHSRSIVELKVFIHDVNSNTYWGYLEGKYVWYREWTYAPQKLDIVNTINIGSGEPLHFDIEHYATGNDIMVKIIQNTPHSTNTKYKIISKILQT